MHHFSDAQADMSLVVQAYTGIFGTSSIRRLLKNSSYADRKAAEDSYVHFHLMTLKSSAPE